MTRRRFRLRRALGLALLLLATCATAPSRAADPAPFDPAKELLRVAKMKQDDRLLASFAEARGRSAPNLTEKELFVIVETVERIGTPDRAIAMLQERVKRFPRDLDARLSLAKMYVRASQSPNAVVVWKELARRLGLTPALAIEYAEVLSVTGDHAAGLAVLVSVMTKAPDDALDYWRALAQNAWDQDDSTTALIAYKKVWKADPPLPAASSRLMQLLADAGQLDEAIIVAKQALVREKNPAHLLFVARLHVKRGDYSAAKRTLDLADDQRALVASTLEYWMLRAEVLGYVGDKDGVRAAHRTALLLDPDAPGVRAALLWDSIDRNDTRRLTVDLSQWGPTALRDREMWGPTAVGLDRIGRTRDAIRFFVMQSKEAPEDHLWALEFADALGRVGEEALSTRIRRRAFAGIRALAVTSLKHAKTQPPTEKTKPATETKPPTAKTGTTSEKNNPTTAKTDTTTTRTDDPPTTRTDDPPTTRTDDPPTTRTGGAKTSAAKTTRTGAAKTDDALNAEPTDALNAEPTAAPDETLLETHAFLTRQLRGGPEAERWVRHLLAGDTSSVALEEFAVGWYLQEDNVDRARRHLAKARLLRLERGSARRYALLIAMADDDRVEIEHLLKSPNDLSDGEKVTAYLRIDRDDRALQPLVAILDRSDATTSSPPDDGLQADSDAPTLRRELRGIEERTSPTLGGGGNFVFINDLAITGPTAFGSTSSGPTRIVYSAGGRQFVDFGTSSVAVDGRAEADAQVSARRLGPRHAHEGRLGIDYQTKTPNGLPLPRAGYTGAFQLSRKFSATIDVAVNGRIEDTSFLRVVGLRNAVNIDLAFEPLRRVFLIGSAVALEDHTRSFDYLGVEAGGGLEAGYKILEKVPEWSVGARVGAYGRANRSNLPEDYRAVAKPGETRASLYSPSYQQAMFVMRIARGDFFERARQEFVSFPRYDCEVDGGVLAGIGIRGVRPAAAAAVRCAVSVRVPTNGYLSATGEYIKGVTGLARADNAQFGLTYTQFLR